MASMSSQLYGATIVALLGDLIKKPEAEPMQPAELVVNFDDEVVRGSIILHDGKMMWPPPAKELPAAPPEPGVPTKSSASKAVATPPAARPRRRCRHQPGTLLRHRPRLWSASGLLPRTRHYHISRCSCLPVFVGFQVVWNVKPALHTPLMSVTNAISGIILVGGMLQLIGTNMSVTVILGAIAVLIASINIAGGFFVTNRMLAMFRK